MKGGVHNHQDLHDDQGNKPGDGGADQPVHLHTMALGHYEQDHAHGWRERADHQGKNNVDTQINRVNIELQRQGYERWHQHQQQRQNLNKTAQDQQQHCHRKHELGGRARHRHQQRGNLLGCFFARHHDAHHRHAAYDQTDGGRHDSCFVDCIPQLAPGQLMVKKQVDKDRVQHGNRGRLGWRKMPLKMPPIITAGVNRAGNETISEDRICRHVARS